ncbi:TPA: protein transport protein HofC [Kluyvera ascorbata]|uniref:Type IV pilin biogenesis protein n=1 Tax=Kluyvera genomosp. 2 TaxID=2774054 RepID=A0A2T2Y4K8_9ENTR|nr:MULTISPECIES: protein transport protein HofC [Enterobacteriaceae]HAT3917836.1 protein transport protein HofC [Kluyvera ascorbata]PSR47467.1 type IV pilin biogenesis protein [Kluyvera genomosp. 2]BBQ85489.1 type IV pilin biogenesis protein [Klebsiella sp. WP3-W18-ESBL-02]BBR22487.1 type IV pilin biogenesis protein [Klebsiella sp. WP3-S18-ESBL-05]HAT3942749.1 protein transport protein HofC [Kluyvera ascorbata]
MCEQLWHWRGVDASGAERRGALWASHRPAALIALAQQNIIVLSLKRRTVNRSLWRAQHSCAVISQLATLLQAGLTLSESLALLSQQHPIPQWRALLETLASRLAEGVSLSEGLRPWPEAFPPLYQAMIRTGEITGRLEHCCQALARQQKAQLLLTAKVKKALRYPLIILTLAALVVAAMVSFVLPEFTAIYRTFNTPLPALTLAVMASADAVASAWLPLCSLVLLATGLSVGFKDHPPWQRLRQQLLLALPVMGTLARGQMLSQIFTVLSLTQRAGIAFLQGLETVEETLNSPWWREVIASLRQQVSQGSAIWQAMENCHEFTPLCLQLVRTGEASGALDEMLENLARHHDESTQNLAESLTATLEPLLLIVTGLIIGTLVVAMYLPIFHLGDAIGGTG